MSREIIRIEHLKKAFEDVTPIEDISTTIHQGDVVAVIGPSGTGKSTFIRCINMLEKPTSGKVLIDGDEITAPDANVTSIRRKMGMVFQSFNLFPHMSVVENVMMAPMDQLKLSRQEAYDKAMQLLDNVGMISKAYVYPATLSGGQKQRVAIARSLAMDPKILLLDEPTSALDPERVEEVKAVIYDLAKKGITMIIVTHDMSFASKVANRVFYLDEGGIYEEGTPEQIFEHPQKEKTKRFIYHTQRCSFDVVSTSFDYYDALGMLEQLCRNNRVSRRLQNRISLALEEIIENMIMPYLNDNTRAEADYHFELECADPQHLSLIVECSEANACVFLEKESLSAKLIKGMAEEFRLSSRRGFTRAILAFTDTEHKQTQE